MNLIEKLDLLEKVGTNIQQISNVYYKMYYIYTYTYSKVGIYILVIYIYTTNLLINSIP